MADMNIKEFNNNWDGITTKPLLKLTEEDKVKIAEVINTLYSNPDDILNMLTKEPVIEVKEDYQWGIQNRFKEVSKDTDRKLRYEGYCSKCKKIRPHRFHGGETNKSLYKCMKCKTINEEFLIEEGIGLKQQIENMDYIPRPLTVEKLKEWIKNNG